MNEYIDIQQQLNTTEEDSLMKKLLKKRLNQKGLTLIELLAVIVILAIVAAIALPAIGNIVNNSRDKAILAEASNILAGAKIAKTDNACGAAVSGVTTCIGTKINPYVEGLTLTDAIATAKYTESSSSWELTYTKLDDIQNATKFSVTGFTAGTDTTITEDELNLALQK